jgi:hypothetical protein
VTDEQSEFTAVVAPTSPADADAAFADWLKRHGVERAAIADDDIRIDTMRGPEGEVQRRYRVRSSAIPR